MRISDWSSDVCSSDLTIDSNLSVAATDRNVPHPVLAEAIGAFSYDVDFQREIQKGDAFEFLYEIFVDEEGAVVRTGDLLFAAMKIGRASCRERVCQYV